ncbi:MAG TPA: transaminase, partial [Acidimicrobiales bacterium]
MDRDHLSALLEAERANHLGRNPGSRAQFTAAEHLFTGVPMTWMANWAGRFPLALAEARGNRVTDVDGHTYVDFALGDTGAMAGHSPAPVVDAVRRRIDTLGGITAMLPSEDAEWVAAELTGRFGLTQWSFALSATDANRWALRLARLATGRSKILVFSYCYHGSVDETFVVAGPDGTTRSRPGNVAPAVDPSTTTVAVEFNDLEAVARALRTGEIAAVLAEPALTNIGIVLPEPGFHDGLRALCDETGTLLMIDETHTLSAGPGGCTAAWGLAPDIVTMGKAIAGGIPIGAFGLRAELADRVLGLVRDQHADIEDVGGIGGTLAGNALSMAAARATLGDVLTADAFSRMESLATRLTAEATATISRHGMPWTVTQLGARAEYRFRAPAPRNGTESHAADDPDLDEFLHLYLSNRDILITPFHNMVLMCPTTSVDDVALHGRLFED